MKQNQLLYELDAEATMETAIQIASRVVRKLGFRKASDEAESLAIAQLAAAIFPRLKMVAAGRLR